MAAERREPFGLAHRPDVINRRQRLGDLEGGLVLGKPGTGGVLTAVDRRSRLTRIEKVHNKNAKHWDNWCRTHSTIKSTPAVAAGLATETWSLEKLLVETAKFERKLAALN